MLVGALWADDLGAHDPSAWGGLFRTRDGGATWRHLTPASFGRGAMALALSPLDADHLLLATDSGVLRSRNGGRDWEVEAPEALVGPTFAVTFDGDGARALVSGATAIFRTDGTGWQEIQAPPGSVPARALMPGSVRGSVYLVGRAGLYRSDDWGRSWVSISDGLGAEHASPLLVLPGPPDQTYAVAAGHVWSTANGARSWQPRSQGLPAGSVEILTLDSQNANRLWAVAAGQVFMTNDGGQRWQPVGKPLPEQPVAARGIGVSGDVILVASDRGVYRSADLGERWELPSEQLPAHLEAGFLAPDPRSPATFYVGFAVTPYGELFRRAVEGGRSLGRLDFTNLIGGLVFLALVFVSAGVMLRRLARTYYRSLHPPVVPTSRPSRRGHVAR
jgi:photosystem II stability/assembly factor-like uncharacterized protein